MSLYESADGTSGDGGLAAPAAAGGGAASARLAAKFAALPDQTQKYLTLGAVVSLIVIVLMTTLQETGEVMFITPPETIGGPDSNLVVVAAAMSWSDASAYCHANHAGLASIHNGATQAAAVALCQGMDMTGLAPRGCWIGMNDDYEEGAWRWSDSTPNDFRAFQPGEPNDYGREHNEFGKNNNCGIASANGGVTACDTNGVGQTAAVGEGYVAMRFPDNGLVPGAWNDDPNDGKAGHDALVTSTATSHAGREYGYYPICQNKVPTDGDATAKHTWYTPHQRIAPDGKYVSIPISLPWTDAQKFCVDHGYHDLASVHSISDQASIVNVCAAVANRDGNTGEAAGCWIGMTDRTTEGSWYWSDGSPVDYLAFSPGEPNNWHVQGSQSSYGGQVAGQGTGEDVVSVTFASSRYNGGWNDEHENGKAGLDTNDFTACFGCSQRALGFYVICEKNAPAQKHTAAGVNHWREPTPVASTQGKYLAVPFAVTWDEARVVCEAGGSWPHSQAEAYNSAWQIPSRPNTVGLASIHSIDDQAEASAACQAIVCPPENGPCATSSASGDLMSNGVPHGCWIGMNDQDMEGHFRWSDRSTVNFLHFNPGEPNDWGRTSGASHGSTDGEQYVEMDLRPGRSPLGSGTPATQLGCTHGQCGDAGVPINQGWNDEHGEGVGAHDVLGSGVTGHDTGCFGCQGTYGMYFLCETAAPRGQVGSFGRTEFVAEYCGDGIHHADGTTVTNCGFSNIPGGVGPGR